MDRELQYVLFIAERSIEDAREMINGGAITINGEQIKDLEFQVNKDIAIQDNVFVVRRGKKKYHVVSIVD